MGVCGLAEIASLCGSEGSLKWPDGFTLCCGALWADEQSWLLDLLVLVKPQQEPTMGHPVGCWEAAGWVGCSFISQESEWPEQGSLDLRPGSALMFPMEPGWERRRCSCGEKKLQ